MDKSPCGLKVGTPARVEVDYCDADNNEWHTETVPWRQLKSFLKKHRGAYYVDPRSQLADPENENGMAPGWIVVGFRDATRYELSLRQRVAVWNMTTAATWIETGVLERDAVRVIRHELAAFLKEAGLRGPGYLIPDDLSDPWHVLHDARAAYDDVQTWRRGDKDATTAAFRVAQFIEQFWSIARAPGVQRDWAHQQYRQRGADRNKEKAQVRHARWERHVGQLLSDGRAGSVHAACIIVAEQEPKGINHETVYKVVLARLRA